MDEDCSKVYNCVRVLFNARKYSTKDWVCPSELCISAFQTEAAMNVSHNVYRSVNRSAFNAETRIYYWSTNTRVLYESVVIVFDYIIMPIIFWQCYICIYIYIICNLFRPPARSLQAWKSYGYEKNWLKLAFYLSETCSSMKLLAFLIWMTMQILWNRQDVSNGSSVMVEVRLPISSIISMARLLKEVCNWCKYVLLLSWSISSSCLVCRLTRLWWRAVYMWLGECIYDGRVPSEQFSSRPGNRSRAVWSVTVVTSESNWFLAWWRLSS